MPHNHTSGPWSVSNSSICTSDGKNEIAKITRYGVWMNDGSPYGANNPIGDANARLIAAAPDLLAALEFALPILEGIKGIKHGVYECDLIKIRTAIAKAKRESI